MHTKEVQSDGRQFFSSQRFQLLSPETIRLTRTAVDFQLFVLFSFVLHLFISFRVLYSLWREDKVIDDLIDKYLLDIWVFLHFYIGTSTLKNKTTANMFGGGRYFGLRGQKLMLAVTTIAGLDFA